VCCAIPRIAKIALSPALLRMRHFANSPNCAYVLWLLVYFQMKPHLPILGTVGCGIGLGLRLAVVVKYGSGKFGDMSDYWHWHDTVSGVTAH